MHPHRPDPWRTYEPDAETPRLNGDERLRHSRDRQAWERALSGHRPRRSRRGRDPVTVAFGVIVLAFLWGLIALILLDALIGWPW